MKTKQNKKNTNHNMQSNTTKICWLSDLHLDRAEPDARDALLKQLQHEDFDRAIITGDIATAEFLAEELERLADACGNKPLYFTLGNHDFYGSSLSQTYANVNKLCAKVPNLHHLQDSGIVELNRTTALVGHHGWPDARAGWGRDTIIKSPDHSNIEDFQKLSDPQCFTKMESLGRQSTDHIRKSVLHALNKYKHIVVATHVPPFVTSVFFGDNYSGNAQLPHFANVGMGAMLISIAKGVPGKKITVLCGHTHTAHEETILNITCHVSGSQPGKPRIQQTFSF